MEINVTSVTVPENRIRRKFDEAAILDLANSMESIGNLQPIVLRTGTTILLAGERRLRAARLLANGSRRIKGCPPGCIPFIYACDLTEDELIQAELEENILRRDLTWQEVAAATEQLHRLRLSQNPAQTMGDTAKELGIPKGSQTDKVRDNLIVAQHLADPDVAQAKDKKQALKVIAKKAEQRILAVLGNSADLRQSRHTMIEGPCEETIKTLPAGTFDCIITDPPYGMDMKNQGQSLLQHNYEDKPEEVLPVLELVIQEATRITKPQAHLYMFCDIDNFQKLRLMLLMAGWRPWRTPLVWDKGNMGFLPRPSHGPRRVHELLIFANKGDKEVLVQGAHDVLRIQQDKNLIHPAQKPVALYEDLMSRSCRPGDQVLDPFCGRGTIFLAAARKGLIATGMEKDRQHAAIARLAASGETETPDSSDGSDPTGG